MIADRTIRYLGMAVYSLLVCFAVYWLVASCWWCGFTHPGNIVLMFCGGLWGAFVQLWYVTIPMTAVVVLDVQRRLREHSEGAPNQALHATSRGAGSGAGSALDN